MKKTHTIREVAELLSSVTRALVVSHYNPDADAYGSSCGLSLALRERGVEVICVNESGIVPRYSFIPGVSDVRAELPVEQFDIVIACDCGDLKRLGDRFMEVLGQAPTLINIDHHVSNDLFGTHNLVVSTASSTCEIVFELLAAMSHPITSEVAQALFTGLNGDTGSFRYSNTSARVFQIAAALVEKGAQPYRVAQALYSANTLQSVKLSAAALAALKTFYDGRCAVAVLDAGMYAQYGSTPEGTEGLVERVRDIEGVEIAVFIREDGPLWKISLRSKDVRCNVSEIAATFGGGGHVMAAAFRWKEDYAELERRLVEVIGKVLTAA